MYPKMYFLHTQGIALGFYTHSLNFRYLFKMKYFTLEYIVASRTSAKPRIGCRYRKCVKNYLWFSIRARQVQFQVFYSKNHKIKTFIPIDAEAATKPLLGSPLPVTILLVSYLLFVLKIVRIFMTKRKAYSLKSTLIAYNIFQVIYNGIMFYYICKYFHSFQFRTTQKSFD